MYRRQTINEKIEEALEDAENRKRRVGVDAAISTQTAGRTKGTGGLPDKTPMPWHRPICSSQLASPSTRCSSRISSA